MIEKLMMESDQEFIIHPITARRVPRKRKRQCTGCHDGVRRHVPSRSSAILQHERRHHVIHVRTQSYDGSDGCRALPDTTTTTTAPSDCLQSTKKDLSSAWTSPGEYENENIFQEESDGATNLGFSRQVAAAVSLPAINCLSDADDLEHHDEGIPAAKSVKRPEQRKATKLKRRKACYRHKTDGRSKSLTHIDALDSAMLSQRGEDGDSRSEPDTTAGVAGSQDRLAVPTISTPAGASVAAGSDPALRRRRLSNLYKITSSEYFSVSFDCLDDPGPEEFVAASKGTTLREALATVCERRGIDLNAVHVYLDSSKTPLSLTTTETFWLGGKHLRIKVKDEVKSPIRSLPGRPVLQQQSSRKGSGSYRSGKSSRVLSGAASTEDPTSSADLLATSPGLANHSHTLPHASAASHEGSLKSKGSKTSTRWSGLFSSSYKDTKMDSLVEQLNEYSRHGIPRLPYLLSFETEEDGDEDDEEGLYKLEEDWKQIVTDWASLPERTRQQQNAIWELVQTELAYLRTLKVITDLFMACLCNLQVAQILNEIDTERLFSNIPEIYVANRQFWAENVLPMLKEARTSHAPLDPTIMREAFVKFDELFHPYTKYCLEQTQCQQYCKEKDHDNELFKAYLAWCETQRDCNRLRLMDILVKPMQRLTKYSLLLKAVHKKTDDENHKTALIDMIQGVESFVGNVNSALRQRHEQERLREIISRIESYDAVDAKDEEIERLLRTHCDLDLTRPMPGCSEHQRRHLLTEGDLKLRDQVSSKIDVHCFLFTDILLICKPVARKAERVRVVRPPFLVDRLVVIELTKDPAALGLVYLNELGTASAAFSLHAPEVKQSKAWLENIRKAQDLYREAKLAAAAAQADTLFFVGDEDDDMDFPASALLVARSPRGSSRGSRGSSLVHSHSGSVDMNETSGMAASARSPHPEVPEVKRASSASSEDSAGTSTVTGTTPIGGGAMKPLVSSPRPERRSILGRPHHQSHSLSPTPNTLTVQVPHIITSHQGQSLPNLLSLAVPVPLPSTTTTKGGLSSSNTTLLPTGRVSPSGLAQRGVSYPPPSPRGLTRTQPVPQSRNPPLVKTRRIASTAGGIVDTAASEPVIVEATNANVELPPGILTNENIEVYNETVSEVEDELGDQEADDLNRQLLNAALAKRLARNDRLDSRRYHTAGAIEDIKKQDAKSNSTIHKRLSWNYGQQAGSIPGGAGSTTAGSSLSGSRILLRSGMISGVNTDSMLSFSSSGVSSTGSLHLSTASEAEDNEAEPGETLKPHVSSTYIGALEATNVQVRLYQDKPSQHVVQLTEASPARPPPPPPPPRCLPVPSKMPFNNDLRIDVSEVCDGISSVQITVSSADGSKPSRADLIRMKDLILSDASMEASEV